MWQNSQTQNVTKLTNSKFDKTQKLKMWQNSKNSKFDKTQNMTKLKNKTENVTKLKNSNSLNCEKLRN